MEGIKFGWASKTEIRQLQDKDADLRSPKEITAFIAKLKNETIAYAAFEKNELIKLFVKPENRKMNFSEIFLRNAIRGFFARSLPVHSIDLYASAEDTRKQKQLERWYRKMGFRNLHGSEKLFRILRHEAPAQTPSKPIQAPQTKPPRRPRKPR